MSTSRQVTVWCDGTRPGGQPCTDWTYGACAHSDTAASARAGARAEGWVRAGKRDLCPACAASAKVKV